jgi:hypothetical protein
MKRNLLVDKQTVSGKVISKQGVHRLKLFRRKFFNRRRGVLIRATILRARSECAYYDGTVVNNQMRSYRFTKHQVPLPENWEL